MIKLGIVGGSGAKEVAEELAPESKVQHVSAPGLKNIDYYHFNCGEAEVYFVLRHGEKHDLLPAELDQRGILRFFKQREAGKVILTSATGSLDTKVKLVDEGGFVVNDSVFRGFGYQGISFSDLKNPHAVLADPFNEGLRKLLLDSITEVPGATAYDNGLYIQNEGNSFESPAEIADLVCRLDAPSYHLAELKHLVGLGRESLQEEVELYERLALHLNRTHAQVGMNAVRSTILALEAGLNVGLVSFPVNYGAGLIPAEQVDHERTVYAIKKATKPYIVPFLKKVIEKAPQYL